MKQNPNQIRIGDVLYEASTMRKKVISWRIDDIFLEDYVSGKKTIIRATATNCCLGTRSFFVADIINMCDTPEEAEKKLNNK